MAMHIVKESRKFIKPSNPTPPNLRQLKLGFIDEFAPFISVSIALFFSVDNNNSLKFVAQIEKSLEKILTPFYPLAGRYADQELQTIDCNDQGAEFIKATCNITLQDFLDHTKSNVELVDEFIPNKFVSPSEVSDPLLSVQVTVFECGGVGLGVSISHKIADASTLSTFLTHWGHMTPVTPEENEVELKGTFGFNSCSLFPSRGLRPLVLGASDDELGNCVTLKLSFSKNVISNLKAKMALNRRNGSEKWSKVQIVSSVILHGLIRVDQVNNFPRDCIVFQPVNLREKTKSLIPKDTCGNLWGILTTNCGITENTEELADLLRDSIKKTVNDYSKIQHDDEELGQAMILNSFSQMAKIPAMAMMVWITSWCRFPFYEADFGYGKPVWASCGSIPVKSIVCLMDGIGGHGVEAYVCLDVKDVSCFEEALNIINGGSA